MEPELIHSVFIMSKLTLFLSPFSIQWQETGVNALDCTGNSFDAMGKLLGTGDTSVDTGILSLAVDENSLDACWIPLDNVVLLNTWGVFVRTWGKSSGTG